MSPKQAIAEVFITALRSLPKSDREAVLSRIADDEQLREELLDLTLIAERRDEPSRPFRQYLAERKR